MDQRAVAPAATEQPVRRGIRRTLASVLFGHDYFLSYGRQDGAVYAGLLADALEQRGLTVCFDRTDFDPGSSLSRTLKRRVERSHRLLLVDTPQVRRSRYVAEEIGHAIRRRRAIVRIADTTSTDVGWTYVDPAAMGLDDIISLDELPLGIAGGTPSTAVVDEVVRTGRKTRSLRRLTLAAVALAALFAGVVHTAWRLREMATSRELAAESTRLVETAAGDALTLAVQAAERWPTDEARRALSRALSGYRLLRVLPDSLHGDYAAFSADGSMVATVGVDGRQHVWDVRSGRELLVLADPESVAGSDQAAPTLWPAGQGTRLLELCGRSPLRLPGLTADCSRFVTNSGRRERVEAARVWDVASGRRLFELADHLAIRGNISSNDLVVVQGDRPGFRIWNVRTGLIVRDLQPCSDGSVNATAFSDDASRVVIAFDAGACVWDLRTGSRPVELSGHTDWVTDAAFSPDGTLVVTASRDQTARIWDAQTGAEATAFSSNAGVTHAEFSADGRSLLTTSGEDPNLPPDGPDEGELENFDPVARVWDWRSSALLYALLMDEDEDIVRYAAFSPDGNLVVTVGDGPTRIWTDNARRLDAAPAAAATAGGPDMTTSPDGTLAIVGASVRRVATGDEIFTLDGPGEPLAAAFSLDGSGIVAVYSNTIHLVDARTGGIIEAMELEDVDELDRAIIAPDRTIVAGTHTYHSKTTLWNIRDRRSLDIAGSIEAWSADGTAILTTYQRARSAILWDAATGTRLQRFPGGMNGVNDTRFSPDGSMIVTTDADGVTRIWDARTGREHDSLPRHTGSVAAVFSGDGAFVHVSDGNGATSVYPIRFAELLALARARLPP